jgi:hypothetical protein
MSTAITPALMPRKQPPAPKPVTTARTARHRSVAARRTVLLAAIHHRRGVWTTGRVREFYRTALSTPVGETNCRHDLISLYADGHLDRHEVSGRVRYTLRTKDGTA